jgi:hypothetical protein
MLRKDYVGFLIVLDFLFGIYIPMSMILCSLNIFNDMGMSTIPRSLVEFLIIYWDNLTILHICRKKGLFDIRIMVHICELSIGVMSLSSTIRIVV